MNKTEFLQSEIKHVIEVINLFSPEDKDKYLQVASELNEEELVKLLKILYKIEQEYFELVQQDTESIQELLNSLK